MKRLVLAILAAGFWISLSEFLRNEFVLKGQWTGHYDSLGLIFPSSPLNGAMWGLWSFILAGCIVAVRRRLSFWGTVALCWITGFLLMWIVIGNLGFLPIGLLPVAVPWSFAELAIAAVIAQSIIGKRKA